MTQHIESLCVCMTPLHVLIAERIAQERGRHFDYGIYLCHEETPKHRFYASRLAAISKVSDFKVEQLVAPTGPLRHWHWVTLLNGIRERFEMKFAGQQIKEVVSSTSADRVLMALLAAVKPGELTTFDDGFANVDPAPPPIFVHTRWPQRLILKLAGIGWWPERVHQHSARHYTIYKQTNVVSRTEHLALGVDSTAAEASPLDQSPDAEEIVVFLGPYPEVEKAVLDAFELAASKLKPIGYLPHPRDTHGLLGSVKRIDSLLVAEDFVVQQLRDHGAASVQVYGYNSSGLVNLAAIKGARAYNFVLAGSSPTPGGRMMEQMGVSLVDF